MSLHAKMLLFLMAVLYTSFPGPERCIVRNSGTTSKTAASGFDVTYSSCYQSQNKVVRRNLDFEEITRVLQPRPCVQNFEKLIQCSFKADKRNAAKTDTNVAFQHVQQF